MPIKKFFLFFKMPINIYLRNIKMRKYDHNALIVDMDLTPQSTSDA